MVSRVKRYFLEIKDFSNTIDLNLPENYSEIVSHLSPDEIPHHYCCPILQEIMTDPVKTVDGFTYERTAIETWFQIRVTSPLTGLALNNSDLVPNIFEMLLINKILYFGIL